MSARDPRRKAQRSAGSAKRSAGSAKRGAGSAERAAGSAKRSARSAKRSPDAGTAKRGSRPTGIRRDQRASAPKKPARTVIAPIGSLELHELEAVKSQVQREIQNARAPARWNADPNDVKRSVARLVLALVEFLRKLLERQAIRRMEAGTLTEEETERVGLALMRLEETVVDIAAQFELKPEDLNLDLGPIGKLM